MWDRLLAWLGYGDVGARGEQEAARVLRGAGYRILARNLRATWGEIDILAEDPDGRTIVVVEVKARVRKVGATGQSATVAPEASITAAKRRKLLRLLDAVTRANGWEARPKRIDSVAVEFVKRADGGEDVVVRHTTDAVTGRR